MIATSSYLWAQLYVSYAGVAAAEAERAFVAAAVAHARAEAAAVMATALATSQAQATAQAPSSSVSEGLAWSDIFLGEDGGDDGVVSADGEVLPVEVRAPDCEGVNHGEEFLLVGVVVSSGSERVSRSGEVNSSEEVVEVVSAEAMLWKKRGRGGADLGMVEVLVEVDKSGFDWGGTIDDCVTAGVVVLGEGGGGATMVEVVVDEGGDVQVDGVGVEVEVEACPEEGVGWGVEEGGVVVVTTVMAGEFPWSVVTQSEMATMVVLMVAREDLREVNVWRIVASSRVVVVEVG
ncbi:hypothetical protein CBR_g27955 [Chara braunii]|uniref:Uncharacterized protein n=1 Tax=Chara braunii TaxID=69332 RepID=A0A388L8T6_CHABU|nr:hypothetical protein CBR_g27955 [Chara braunii]|eukprot:GBG78730.1 hypothetical protein CBR_g27955 [Chara braunii]